jgi:hypothetical protein
VALAFKVATANWGNKSEKPYNLNLKNPNDIFNNAANGLTGKDAGSVRDSIKDVAQVLNHIQDGFKNGYKKIDAIKFANLEPNQAINQLTKLAETMVNVQKQQQKAQSQTLAFHMPGRNSVS